MRTRLRISLLVALTVSILAASSARADTIDLNAAPQGAFTSLTLGAYTLTYAGGDKEAIAYDSNISQNVLIDSNNINVGRFNLHNPHGWGSLYAAFSGYR